MIHVSTTGKEKVNPGRNVSVLKEQKLFRWEHWKNYLGPKKKYRQRPCAGLRLCFAEPQADRNEAARGAQEEVRVEVRLRPHEGEPWMPFKGYLPLCRR